MPYRPMPWVHSQSFQPLVSITRPSSRRSRNSPELSLISTRLRIRSCIWRSISGWDTNSPGSVEMEHRCERPFARPAVGVGFHEIAHVFPPATHHRVLRQLLAPVGFTQLEHCEQVQGFLV